LDKKQLSESDICDKFIRPAMEQAGWHGLDQIYREFPLRAGRVSVRGNKAHRDQSTVLRADYALFFKANIPIAVVEAKDNNKPMGSGMAQAINYAELLGVPFCFASNGDGFVFRDATLADGVLERNLSLEEFPSPQDLWERYCAWKGWTLAVRRVTEFDYAPSKTPRYYQINAINRTVEAIAQGQNRAMLVMATGTGKTYTAFQIIWRLWKSGAKKRILFLADRNILIDQTMVNDFRPFKGAMAKLSPNAKGVERVDAQGQITVEEVDLAVNKTTKLVDKSYEIYLSLYQAVTGTEEERNIYKQFSPDFFDLIVVDECHRGSANEDSAWREILNYFSSAAQVGLTATPKETQDTSNSDYFGEPIYTYSLKQGIEDGFLSPYKVVRVDLDKDTFGWRPTQGMTDKHGHLIEDRIYNATDMNRKLVLEQRDQVVAAKITEYLKATDRYAKTIVFCEDIDHAAKTWAKPGSPSSTSNAPPSCLPTRSSTVSLCRFTSPKVMNPSTRLKKPAHPVRVILWFPASPTHLASSPAVIPHPAAAVTTASPRNTYSAAWSPWPWPASACNTSAPMASSSPKACATTPASTWPSNTTRSTSSCKPGTTPTAKPRWWKSLKSKAS
jgi:type I restriction enzyme R subunit